MVQVSDLFSRLGKRPDRTELPPVQVASSNTVRSIYGARFSHSRELTPEEIGILRAYAGKTRKTLWWQSALIAFLIVGLFAGSFGFILQSWQLAIFLTVLGTIPSTFLLARYSKDGVLIRNINQEIENKIGDVYRFDFEYLDQEDNRHDEEGVKEILYSSKTKRVMLVGCNPDVLRKTIIPTEVAIAPPSYNQVIDLKLLEEGAQDRALSATEAAELNDYYRDKLKWAWICTVIFIVTSTLLAFQILGKLRISPMLPFAMLAALWGGVELWRLCIRIRPDVRQMTITMQLQETQEGDRLVIELLKTSGMIWSVGGAPSSWRGVERK